MVEPFWLRHDLHVLGVCALVLLAGWSVRGEAPGRTTRAVAVAGVGLRVPSGWILDTAAGAVRGDDAVTGVEVRVEEAPPDPVVLDTALELDRGRRYGELYQRTGTGDVKSGGRTWRRTTYAYAFKPSPTHTPRIASAVEYALAAGGHAYVVTLHAGSDARLAELEPVVLSAIEVKP
jgi:hypothetical protein